MACTDADAATKEGGEDMKTMKEMMAVTARSDYRRNFWDAMRSIPHASEYVLNALDGDKVMYLPSDNDEMFQSLKARHGVFRNLASCMRMYDSTSEIWAYDSEDYSQFVDDCDPIPGFDSIDEFTKIPVNAHKMASLVRMSLEFVRDSSFDVEKHLTKRMARTFARTEDRAFVNGTGVGEPTGLLHDTEGAETASTVDSIAYDDCIDLFFSVKPEYRANAVWMMNDRTALALRKLKDDDGNYLWNQAKDSILGKSVVICNEMPDADEGSKPVLFGDLSYYWVIDRKPASIKPLWELFTNKGQVGYIVQERLDAKLIRPEAVKVLAIIPEQE